MSLPLRLSSFILGLRYSHFLSNTDGLRLIFPNAKPSEMMELAHYLVGYHKQFFCALGLDFPYWNNKLLGMKEIEHALCEYCKFKKIIADFAKNKKSSRRKYKSRALLDEKPCKMCDDHLADDGPFCDTCFNFYCSACAPKSTVAADKGWICPRCEDFDNFFPN